MFTASIYLKTIDKHTADYCLPICPIFFPQVPSREPFVKASAAALCSLHLSHLEEKP